jgi:hypothetical protein
MKYSALIHIFLLLMTTNSCRLGKPSEKIQESDVIGSYIAGFDAGLYDSLLIFDDNTYQRIFVTWDSVRTVDKGKWDLLFLGTNEVDINFAQFIKRYPVHSEDDHGCRFSQRQDATIDSTPRYTTMSIWKGITRDQPIVRIQACVYRDHWYKVQSD